MTTQIINTTTSDGFSWYNISSQSLLNVTLSNPILSVSSSGLTIPGNITAHAESHFAYTTFTDPDTGVARDAKFGNKGIAVAGGVKTDTLNVTKTTTLNNDIFLNGNFQISGTNGFLFGQGTAKQTWFSYDTVNYRVKVQGDFEVTNELFLDYDSLPSNDPNIRGQVWNNGGVLSISKGNN